VTYQSMPKVELHTHLEGCAPPAFIRGLATEKGIDINGIFNADGTYSYRDFDHFLKIYETACTALQTPQDFYRLTKAVLEESASHGVVYQETFISPDFCGGGDLTAWRDYIAAMAQAADEMADTITLKGIVTCIRHFDLEKAKRATHCAVETFGDFVVGFGMAGAEMVGRPGDFSYVFDQAREAKMPLRDLRPARIGHGVNAIKDPDLVEQLAELGTVLEVCPGSNVFLRATGGWGDHPIKSLREAGVKVTVSTDDPPFFGTTMTHEFNMLSETFGWDTADFKALNQTALDAAFCDETTRATIAKRLEP